MARVPAKSPPVGSSPTRPAFWGGVVAKEANAPDLQLGDRLRIKSSPVCGFESRLPHTPILADVISPGNNRLDFWLRFCWLRYRRHVAEPFACSALYRLDRAFPILYLARTVAIVKLRKIAGKMLL